MNTYLAMSERVELWTTHKPGEVYEYLDGTIFVVLRDLMFSTEVFNAATAERLRVKGGFLKNLCTRLA